MVRIKVSHNFGDFPLIRQTPGRLGAWGGCEFLINKKADECDFWVVFEGLENKESVKCRKGGKILVTGEPPAIKKYSQKFLDQFDWVISSHKGIRHKGLITEQQSLPWLVGLKFDPVTGKKLEDYSKDYDELIAINSLQKTKEISVICSNKTDTEGQHMRLRFVEKLKEQLGDRIDVFGRGFNYVSDKWDAIAPYKYHICLENDSRDDWWTEKLADSFLGLAYPIYWGAPNIHKYFPKDSYFPVDISDPNLAVREIKKFLDEDQYDEQMELIKESKRLVLDKYNFFPHIADFIGSIVEKRGDMELVALEPEKRSFTKRFAGRIHKAKVPFSSGAKALLRRMRNGFSRED